jgi:hypothetical protein
VPSKFSMNNMYHVYNSITTTWNLAIVCQLLVWMWLSKVWRGVSFWVPYTFRCKMIWFFWEWCNLVKSIYKEKFASVFWRASCIHEYPSSISRDIGDIHTSGREGILLSFSLFDSSNHNKGCITPWPCHLPLKSMLRQKEELWKTQIFHHVKIYNFPKKNF